MPYQTYAYELIVLAIGVCWSVLLRKNLHYYLLPFDL